MYMVYLVLMEPNGLPQGRRQTTRPFMTRLRNRSR